MEINNKKHTIVNTDNISKKDIQRLFSWSQELIAKNEYRLSADIKPGTIIATGEIKPEDIDVGEIYNFCEDLRWRIWRWHQPVSACWCVMLLSGHKILINFFFAKI